MYNYGLDHGELGEQFFMLTLSKRGKSTRGNLFIWETMPSLCSLRERASVVVGFPKRNF